MDALRIITAAVWTVMLVYMAPGAWAAVRGRTVRRGDPMRLACFLTGVMIVGFSLRHLLFPESMVTWAALYIFSISIAVYIIALARAYGRGPHV